MKKFFIYFVAISLFIGCGYKINISGKAIDGYLKNATVFIDINKNGVWDKDEPKTKTDETGFYKLAVYPLRLYTHPSIIVYGGIDDSTGEEFTGQLSSVIYDTKTEKVNISILSTLVDDILGVDITKKMILKAKDKVASTFDISSKDIDKDPIAEFTKNPKIYKQGLIIKKMIEVINAKEGNAQNIENFKKVLKVFSNLVKEGKKLDKLDSITLDGKSIDIKDELDLIVASVDELKIVPSNDEGYKGALAKTTNKEEFEKLINQSNEEKVKLAKDIITEDAIKADNISLGAVIKNLNLNINPYRTKVKWTSSNQEVLKNDGTVIRPKSGEDAVSLVLRADISKGNSQAEKSFNITVLPMAIKDIDAVAFVKDRLTFESIKLNNIDKNNITSKLNLYTKAKYDVQISWTSSDENVITKEGIVKRPDVDENDAMVILSANIKKNDASFTKKFTLKVVKIPLSDKLAVQRASDDLDISKILNKNTSKDRINSDLILPKKGMYGVNILWFSSDDTIIAPTGIVHKPSNDIGDSQVTLSAKISKGNAFISKDFILTVLSFSDEEVLDGIYPKLTFEKIKNQNQKEDVIISDLNLIKTIQKASIIWSSSDENIINPNTGKVTRPDISNQQKDTKVRLSASISYKSASKTMDFELVVKAFDSSLVNALAKDVALLTFDLIKQDNQEENKIKTNLSLPSKGMNGTNIVWTSSNTELLSNSGELRRPSFEKGSQKLTLKAKISNASGEETKEFHFTVLPKLAVDKTLAFKQKASKTQEFRTNGLSYKIAVYSNLIKDENLLSNTKAFNIKVRVNTKVLKALEVPLEYAKQNVKVKIYSSDDTLVSERLVSLSQKDINLGDIVFEDKNSLKIPSFKRADTLKPPMVRDF